MSKTSASTCAYYAGRTIPSRRGRRVVCAAYAGVGSVAGGALPPARPGLSRARVGDRIVIMSTKTRRAPGRRADCRRARQGAGSGVHWYDVPSEGCCSFVFPCVTDPGNMLQFKRDFRAVFRGARNPDVLLAFNPSLPRCDMRLAQNRSGTRLRGKRAALNASPSGRAVGLSETLASRREIGPLTLPH
jgi:hypothetical protein